MGLRWCPSSSTLSHAQCLAPKRSFHEGCKGESKRTERERQERERESERETESDR